MVARQSSVLNALVITSAAAALCFADGARADVIRVWNQLALDSIVATSGAPPASARNLAILHTSMYNSVGGLSGRALYGGAAPGPVGASPEAAAAQAAHDVLAFEYPSRAAIFDAELSTELAAIADPVARAAGVAYGQQSAAGIIGLRASDGSSATPPYSPSLLPGRWRPTGALSTPQFQQYATVTPWTMSSPSQFRPAPPPALGSSEYAAAVNQVQAIGSATSATRTPEQTQIARMWAAGSGTVTPPGMWNQIAQQTIAARPISLVESARAFALLNMGLADAAVVAWDAKATYDFWRPITAIRLADIDGNAATIQDPSWTPLLTTPQFQSYISGHSTFSATAAAILSGFFGTDNIAFTASDGSISRSFTSFSAAAAEAGMSRIYGGIHYSFDNIPALEAGASLGSFVYSNYLVPTPGSATILGMLVLGACRRRRPDPTA